MSLKNWLILIVLGTSFGVSFSLNTILLEIWSPITISVARVGVGAIGCWIWVFATGRDPRLPSAPATRIAVFGTFQYALPFALLPLAQKSIGAGATGIANAMMPVAVVLVSLAWPGGERPSATKSAGVAVGTGAILTLMSSDLTGAGIQAGAVTIAVLAPICYAVALNVGRAFVGVDTVVLMAYAMTFGALLLLPVSLVVEGIPALPTPRATAAVLIFGFGLTTVTFVALYRVLPQVGTINASIVTMVAPLSALTIGGLVFGEAITGGHLAGMTGVLLALGLIDGRPAPALLRGAKWIFAARAILTTRQASGPGHNLNQKDLR